MFNCAVNNYSKYILIILSIIILMCQLHIKFVKTEECHSMDLRNSVYELERLKPCSVIFGSLHIVLMNKNKPSIDLTSSEFVFKKLREITGYLLIYDVDGLKSIGRMFPNLAVIRGQELIHNYALAIFHLPDLVEITLKSLINIQYGAVFVDRCPKLCSSKTINWSFITDNSIYENVIQQDDDHCPNKTICRGCPIDNCWTSFYCQKIYNGTNFNGMKCDEQCLGGCKNVTAAGCNVCKNFTDKGVCLEECPELKNVNTKRCYSKYDCILHNMIPFGNECIPRCPPDYSHFNNVTEEINFQACYPCENCPKICNATEIKHASESLALYNCTIISGSLNIRILNNDENAMDLLTRNLKNIQLIMGVLKIYRSMPLTNLSFLSKLHKIHGVSINNCSLHIYDNSNLNGLWHIKDKLKIKQGSICIYSNDNLCQNKIDKLLEYVSYNNSNNYINTYANGFSLVCNNLRNTTTLIKSDYIVLTYDNVTIKWNRLRFTDEENMKFKLIGYFIYYIEAPSQITTYNYDESVCSEYVWQNHFVPIEKLNETKSYHYYNITNLKQYTQYAYYVKSLIIANNITTNVTATQRQSLIIHFKTLPDIPTSFFIKTLSKTENSITLTWCPVTTEIELVTYYKVDVFSNPDDIDFLDHRNYCNFPRIEKVNDTTIKNVSQINNTTKFNPIETLLNNNNNNNNNDNCCGKMTDLAQLFGIDDDTMKTNNNNGNDNNDNIDMRCNVKNENNMHIRLKRNSYNINNNYNYNNNNNNNDNNNNNSIDDDFYREIYALLLPQKHKTLPLITTTNTKPDDDLLFPSINRKFEKRNIEEYKYYMYNREFSNYTTNFTFYNLKPFTYYGFQFFACNEINCSSYSMLNVRTNSYTPADNVNIKTIKIDDDIGHTIYIEFDPPPLPNGITVAYNIHIYYINSGERNINCITRKQHADNNFVYTLENLQIGYYGIRIRSVSLAGTGTFSDYKFIEIKPIQHNRLEIALLIIFIPFILIGIGIGIVWYFVIRKKRYLAADDTDLLIENIVPNNEDYDDVVSMEDIRIY